jgi:hypothetical protein
MVGKITIIVAICVAIIGSSAWWGTRHEPTPFWPEKNAVGRSIEMEAEEAVLHYQENLFWSENQFSEIMGGQDGFRSAQIDQFKSTYGKQAINARVEFDETKNLTILTCDVHGTKMDNTFDFHWFLNPLGLDFIDNHFQKSENELSWEGAIDGIATTIVLRFPFTINHCHAHVWPA